MLNSEIGRYQIEDKLRQAKRERVAASVAGAQSSRRIQRVSTALFGRVKIRKPASAPAPAARPVTVN